MAKKVKSEIKQAVLDNFPEYNPSLTQAPQGSNNFSTNVLVENGDGVFLIKIIELGKLSPDTLEQTFDLVKAAEEIASPFFVPLIEVKKTAEYVFLRFPFLSGKNLAEYRSEKVTFSEKELKNIAISLLRGISK